MSTISHSHRQILFNLIEQTAKQVARSGPELETMLKEQAFGNEKLSFLEFDNVYRPYFDTKVEAYQLSNQA